ncbi:hypothetical protein [Haloarcula amylolytica]|uniref:hypothetical protein n=1 Tax=Haloarcula amylolytica TaxID=396317 RepID=UPI003C7446FB
MSDKSTTPHDVNRINDYEERDVWDMFIQIWTSKLGILAGAIIILALCGISISFLLGWLNFKIVWGTTELVAVLSVLASLGLGGWFIVLPMLSLDSTDFEILVKLNSTHDSIIDGWIMHPVRMAKVSVDVGQVYKESVLGVTVYFVRDYDPSDRIAKGTWRGEMNDVELETHVQAMEQNRGQLRQWAMIGQQLYAKLPGIAQSIENRYWNDMTKHELEKEAIKHPDIVTSEVTKSVEMLVDSIETPDEADSEEMMEEEVKEEVGEIPDEWGDNQ